MDLHNNPLLFNEEGSNNQRYFFILLFIGFFSTEVFNISLTVCKHLLGLFAPTTLCLKDLHDNLLFFNEEGSNNSFSDAFVATRSTVCSGHTLQALGHSAALEWPWWGDSLEFDLAVTAFWNAAQLLLVVIDKLSTWRLGYLASIWVGVVTQPSPQSKPLRHLNIGKWSSPEIRNNKRLNFSVCISNTLFICVQ